jgi:acylphosphatase
MKHRQIVIKGKVENTGFRFYVFRGASTLGIRGFVKIDEVGVMVEAEGEDEPLNNFGEWCRKGPDGSTVDSVDCCEKELIGFEDFKIL